MHNIAKTFFPILLLLFAAVVTAQNGKNNVGNAQRIWLDSEIGHQGDYQWKMIKAGNRPRRKDFIIQLCNGKLDAGYRSRNSSKFFGA